MNRSKFMFKDLRFHIRYKRITRRSKQIKLSKYIDITKYNQITRRQFHKIPEYTIPSTYYWKSTYKKVRCRYNFLGQNIRKNLDGVFIHGVQAIY